MTAFRHSRLGQGLNPLGFRDVRPHHTAMSQWQRVLVAVLLILLVVVGLRYFAESPSEREIRATFTSIPDDMPIWDLGDIELILGQSQDFEQKGRQLSLTVTRAADGQHTAKMEYESNRRTLGGLRSVGHSVTSHFLIQPEKRFMSKVAGEVAIVCRVLSVAEEL